MRNSEQIADLLGVWADDPRSVQGLMAIATDMSVAESKPREIGWASRDFMESETDDPRIVATRAAVKSARRPERLLEPGGYSAAVKMEPGTEYALR